MVSGPLILDLVRFGVAREGDDTAIGWKLSFFAHSEMVRVVDELARDDFLDELRVSHQHLKVVVKAHQILHYILVVAV